MTIEALFQTAIDGLIITKHDSTLVRANPYFYRVLGYTETELVGTQILDLIHPEDQEPAKTGLARLTLSPESVTNFPARCQTKSGASMHFLWNTVSDPQQGLVYATARDMTAKVRGEQQLRAVAYMASHDFSEPIRSISQFSSLLLVKEGDRLSERGQRWLKKNIMESSQRLQVLSDDIRDYLKSMREDPELEVIDLNEATLGAVSLMNGKVEETSATIEYTTLGKVWATRQIQQVIYNLLSNAIKYVPEGTAPKVTLTSVSAGDYQILHVQDNGIGFNQKMSEDIFKLGRRLFASSSKYWGSGVGLATVKLHVERMGGQVWATSTPGTGSRFSVKLRKA